MFRRPLISALGAGSRRVIRPAPAPAQRLWQRTFASEAAAAPEAEKTAPPTGPRKKHIFDKASSPELDDVFTELLHKIILPAHLPAKQYKTITNSANAHKIEVDPIVIEVEGYEHRFGILDYKQNQVPKTHTLVNKALDLLKTRDDWDNLVRLTSGLRRAHRLVNRSLILAIIRHAGKSGNMYAVVDAFRNSKRSGLRIRNLPTMDNCLHYLQSAAVESGYAEEPTRDALTWANMLLELSQDPEHAKPSSAKVETRPLRPLHREPQVIGQLLHLAAAQAVHHRGGRDSDDGQVAKLAETLALVWPEGRPLKDLNAPYEIPVKGTDRARFAQTDDAHLAASVSRHISVASFILHGLRLAKQVVEPELAARLEPIEKVLDGEVADLAARRPEIEKAREGWAVYDKLIAQA